MHAVGDRLHRHAVHRPVGPQRLPHLAGDVAVQLADRVDAVGRPQRQRRHVELRPVPVVVLAQGEEAGPVLAQLAPGAGQVLLDELEREGVVAGGHRGVGREHGGAAHQRDGLVERAPLLDLLADPLHHHEGGVPLVEVPDGRLDAHRAQHADAADAEDDLLLDAGLAVAAVQPGRQLPIPGRVLVEVGVEQVEADVADPDPPDGRQDRAIAERHRGDTRLAVGRDRRLDRGVGPVDPFVVLLLPAVVVHALVEVALRVHEADADQRHAEVAGLLAVIAGQHAEAAGVDRQRLVQGELGREIGDGAAIVAVALAAPPRAGGLPRRVEPGDGRVVQPQELGVLGRPLQRLGAEHPQHPRRVVRGGAPRGEIEAAEERARVRAPAPPHVGGELAEAVDASGKRGGEAFHS